MKSRYKRNMKLRKKEIRAKNRPRRIKILVCFITLLLLLFIWGKFIEPNLLFINDYKIVDENLPNSFNGLRVVHFTDLNYGLTKEKRLKRIVNDINSLKPDIVVFTGDLINPGYKLSSKEQEKLIKTLQSIKTTIGKYAILGDEDNEKIATIFNQSDFIILRDEYDLIYNSKDNPILLIGINSNKKNPDIDKAFSYFKEPTHLNSIYTITLIHEPDLTDEVSYQSDLILAGHSHNGKVRNPFTNHSIFKVNGAKKYNDEYYQLERSELYISSGLGTKSGFRLFCRPSINFFRLSNK